MIHLPRTLQSWGSSAFEATLCQEVATLGADALRLQQGLTRGSYALEDHIGVLLLAVTESETTLVIRAGIQYTSMIAGCNCADDPSPIDRLDEYCTVQIEIEKASGVTRIQPEQD